MQRTKTKNGFLIGIIILGALFFALSVMYALNVRTKNSYQASLENMYQKNFYELVDEINNTETKLNKVLASESNAYKSKMLKEISQNAREAETRLNMLPYSMNGVSKTITFVNQLSGYTQTLSKNLDKGMSLTEQDEKSLEKIYDNVVSMKRALNTMSKEMWDGYNITNASFELDGDYNIFTSDLSNMNSSDIEYPTMIYDGPFSDSQIKKDVKGLNFSNISKEEGIKMLSDIMLSVPQDEIVYVGEGNGNFQTYNYSFNDDGGYAQLSIKGGKLITLSMLDESSSKKIELESAKQIALDFAKLAGFNSMQVVWSDIVGDDAYINLAPVQNGIILYPDLVKAKVDLSNGNILGFEATSYFLNHTNRNIGKVGISKEEAESKVCSKLTIKDVRLALIPLDYEEILCYEFVCVMNGSDYYVYVNAQNGNEENILKVIETDNGNLLM